MPSVSAPTGYTVQLLEWVVANGSQTVVRIFKHRKIANHHPARYKALDVELRGQRTGRTVVRSQAFK